MQDKLSRPSKRQLAFLEDIIKDSIRVFNADDIRAYAERRGYKSISIRYMLYALVRKGYIEHFKSDFFALNTTLLGEEPINEFEIAAKLAKKFMISHLSAFHYHGLIKQKPNPVFLTVTSGSEFYKLQKARKTPILGFLFKIVGVKEAWYFGGTKINSGKSKLLITDLERTLIDGLAKSEYCGGFLQVYQSFVLAKSRIDLDKMEKYAGLYPISAIKRLGWVLDSMAVKHPCLHRFQNIHIQARTALDPRQPKNGPFVKKWGIQVNTKVPDADGLNTVCY